MNPFALSLSKGRFSLPEKSAGLRQAQPERVWIGRRLLPLELRLALLEEGHAALHRIGARPRHALAFGFGEENLAERAVERGLDIGLHGRVRHGRAFGQAGGQRHRFVHQSSIVDRLVDQAPFGRLFGTDAFAQHHHLRRARLADRQAELAQDVTEQFLRPGSFQYPADGITLFIRDIATDGRLLVWRKPVAELHDCPHKLSFVFQSATLMPWASVLDNVALGAHRRGHKGWIASMLRADRAEEAAVLAEAMRQIERCGLADVAHTPAASLPLGQQRIVEIARALAGQPAVLLLDEPAAGLRHLEKQSLAKLLMQLRAEGLAILVVEHDMEFVMNLADRITVLQRGEILASGDYDRHLRHLKLRIAEGMRAIITRVEACFPPGTRVAAPEAGFLIWVQLPSRIDALEVHRRALALGIGVSPGPLFSPGAAELQNVCTENRIAQ